MRAHNPLSPPLAVKGYLPLVSDTTDRFIDAIRARLNQPISTPSAAQLLGYELIGEVAWGEPFENIKNWKLNPSLYFIDRMTLHQQVLGQTPWLMNLIVNLPIMTGAASLRPYAAWIRNQIESRLKKFEERPDAMTKIVNANRDLGVVTLHAESDIMVIAGGYVLSTLSFFFFFFFFFQRTISNAFILQ